LREKNQLTPNQNPAAKFDGKRDQQSSRALGRGSPETSETPAPAFEAPTRDCCHRMILIAFLIGFFILYLRVGFNGCA
jgi:hypothetical protein